MAAEKGRAFVDDAVTGEVAAMQAATTAATTATATVNANLDEIDDAGSDAQKHAQSTTGFKDSTGTDYEKGAKGWAEDAEDSAGDAAEHRDDAQTWAEGEDGDPLNSGGTITKSSRGYTLLTRELIDGEGPVSIPGEADVPNTALDLVNLAAEVVQGEGPVTLPDATEVPNTAIELVELTADIATGTGPITLPDETTVPKSAREERAAAEAAADLAQEWAEKPEDELVDGEDDQYSALHYAAKASADRVLAETARDDVQAAYGNYPNPEVSAAAAAAFIMPPSATTKLATGTNFAANRGGFGRYLGTMEDGFDTVGFRALPDQGSDPGTLAHVWFVVCTGPTATETAVSALTPVRAFRVKVEDYRRDRPIIRCLPQLFKRSTETHWYLLWGYEGKKMGCARSAAGSGSYFYTDSLGDPRAASGWTHVANNGDLEVYVGRHVYGADGRLALSEAMKTAVETANSLSSPQETKALRDVLAEHFNVRPEPYSEEDVYETFAYGSAGTFSAPAKGRSFTIAVSLALLEGGGLVETAFEPDDDDPVRNVRFKGTYSTLDGRHAFDFTRPVTAVNGVMDRHWFLLDVKKSFRSQPDDKVIVQVITDADVRFLGANQSNPDGSYISAVDCIGWEEPAAALDPTPSTTSIPYFRVERVGQVNARSLIGTGEHVPAVTHGRSTTRMYAALLAGYALGTKRPCVGIGGFGNSLLSGWTGGMIRWVDAVLVGQLGYRRVPGFMSSTLGNEKGGRGLYSVNRETDGAAFPTSTGRLFYANNPTLPVGADVYTQSFRPGNRVVVGRQRSGGVYTGVNDWTWGVVHQVWAEGPGMGTVTFWGDDGAGGEEVIHTEDLDAAEVGRRVVTLPDLGAGPTWWAYGVDAGDDDLPVEQRPTLLHGFAWDGHEGEETLAYPGGVPAGQCYVMEANQGSMSAEQMGPMVEAGQLWTLFSDTGVVPPMMNHVIIGGQVNAANTLNLPRNLHYVREIAKAFSFGTVPLWEAIEGYDDVEQSGLVTYGSHDRIEEPGGSEYPRGVNDYLRRVHYNAWAGAMLPHTVANPEAFTAAETVPQAAFDWFDLHARFRIHPTDVDNLTDGTHFKAAPWWWILQWAAQDVYARGLPLPAFDFALPEGAPEGLDVEHPPTDSETT